MVPSQLPIYVGLDSIIGQPPKGLLQNEVRVTDHINVIGKVHTLRRVLLCSLLPETPQPSIAKGNQGLPGYYELGRLGLLQHLADVSSSVLFISHKQFFFSSVILRDRQSVVKNVGSLVQEPQSFLLCRRSLAPSSKPPLQLGDLFHMVFLTNLGGMSRTVVSPRS